MLKPQVDSLLEYHYWAYERLFAKIDTLTPEQFTATTDFPHGSIRDTLVHLLFADLIWRVRMQGETFDRDDMFKLYEEKKQLSFAALRQAFTKEMIAMQSHFNTLKEDDIQAEFSYADTSGKEYTDLRVNIFTHVVMHGMQHRAELAQMLTTLDQSPGNIDYIEWLRED